MRLPTNLRVPMIALCAALGGCTAVGRWLPGGGPLGSELRPATGQIGKAVSLVMIDEQVTMQLKADRKAPSLADAFGAGEAYQPTIGPGDVLEISVWEAPPAMLFARATLDPRGGAILGETVTFPEQMVAADGTISMPFTKPVAVAGRSTREVELDIANRLQGKANQPQVLVRLLHNNTANVTLVGDVSTSLRMPLTAKGERLLDALAAGGGVKQSVDRTTIKVARRSRVASLPLERILQDPQQNIFLAPGDVITALYQPLSFTVLGASGKSDEINFEAQGISLAQALARAGGLNDLRADAQGLFIFRYENPQALNWATPPAVNADGKVPVIYQLDLRDPQGFLIAQNFPIANRDVVYIANAPAAELQKFLNIVTGALVYPALTVVNATR